MFEGTIAAMHSRPIEVKARFINGLPGAYPGPQPRVNSIVLLRQVTKVGDETYFKIRGYSDWFYARRFKEVV